MLSLLFWFAVGFWVTILVITTISFSYDLNLNFSSDVNSKDPMVICLGLPRTATCSTAEALKILGYQVQHLPISLSTNLSWYKQKKNALLDVTMLGLRPKQLYAMFPNAIFMYNFRDEDKWVTSMIKLQELMNNFTFIPRVNEIFTNCQTIFGTTPSEMLAAKALYETEIDHIEEFGAKVHKVDFTLEPCKNWQKLCAIVPNSGVPNEKFPHINHVTYHLRQAWGF